MKIRTSLFQCIFTLFLFSVTTHSFSSGWEYPSKTGKSGTSYNTVPSVQYAIDNALPGDTIFIAGGTYQFNTALRISCSGEKDNPIIIIPLNNEGVVFDFSDRVFSGEEELHITAPYIFDEGAVQINDAAHVVLKEIHVRNSRNAGFNIRSSSNISLIACSTDYTHGSGISAWFSKNIMVRYCKISRANLKNMPVLNESYDKVGPHEAITMSGVTHFELCYNEISDCAKEGIDIKGASKFGIIHTNYIHHIARQCLYVDGYPYFLANFDDPNVRNGLHFIKEYKGVIYNKTRLQVILELYPEEQNMTDSIRNVNIFNNILHDGNQGIVVSSEGGTPVDSISVFRNLIYNNRNSGIQAASYFGLDGPRSNISIINNSLINNGFENEFWWSAGGIYIETHNINHVIIENNLCSDNGVFQIGTTGQDFEAAGILIQYNLHYGSMEDKTLQEIHAHDTKPDHPIFASAGLNAIGADPLLKDTERGIFTLTGGSPAINGGNPDDTNNDPNGTRNDIGCFYHDQFGPVTPLTKIIHVNVPENVPESSVITKLEVLNDTSVLFFEIIEGNSGSFNTDHISGKLYISSENALDYEIDSVITLKVKATNLDNYTDTFTVVIHVIDLNEVSSINSFTSSDTESLIIYPNPLTGNTIYFNSEKNIKAVYLRDLNGRLVSSDLNNQSITMDENVVISGVYLLYCLFEDNTVSVVKVVKF